MCGDVTFMDSGRHAAVGDRVVDETNKRKIFRSSTLAGTVLFLTMALIASFMSAQVNMLTSHNDISRTGQNLNETILTPANVNTVQFGKLFSRPVNGAIYAQPLYVSQLNMLSKGTHDVIYVATSADMVYAFDADTNGGVNAKPLWQTSLLTSGLTLQYGVLGTPVIDLSSDTIYLVSSEDQGSTYIFRLHALDIRTGLEKLGAPVPIEGSIVRTGSGSVNGILGFRRVLSSTAAPGCCFLNGAKMLYIAFGSFRATMVFGMDGYFRIPRINCRRSISSARPGTVVEAGSGWAERASPQRSTTL